LRKGTCMAYKQIYTSMSDALHKRYSCQEWAAPYLNQGMEFPEVLASPAVMQEFIQSMNAMERRLLKLIVTNLGCMMFTWETLEKHMNDYYAGAEVRASLDALRRYGIICTFRKSWGELLYMLPSDGFITWQSLLLSRIETYQPALKTDSDPDTAYMKGTKVLESIEAYPASSRGIAQQLFLLLWYADNHELLLTAKGILHKKQLQKLTETISMPNEPLNGLQINYSFSEHYEIGFAVLLDFALRLGLLCSEAHKISLNKQVLREWLACSFDHQQQKLYRLWKELWVNIPIWLQHTITLMEKMDIVDGEWGSMKHIFLWLQDSEIPVNGLKQEELQTELLQRWLNPLHSFRFIELAVDGAGELWFRWLIQMGSSIVEEVQLPSGAFYVQPDFELLLPPDVAPHIEWEAAVFAEPRGADLLRVYRITKESFHKAIETGVSGEAVTQFLRNHSIHQVPESLQITLQEWNKQYGKLIFCEVTLLRCESAEVAEAIKNSEGCRSYVEVMLGEKDFIVRKNQAASFYKQLEQMGYSPQILFQPEVNSLSLDKTQRNDETVSLTSSRFAKEQRKGLFHVQDNLQLYEIEPSFPQVAEMYPNMQEIPQLWLKEYRGYHASTSKEMIRKAIEWKCYLKLRKQGLERKIVPKNLCEDRNGWRLVGIEDTHEINLASEDWEEMKLILPGINDYEDKARKDSTFMI
jgi:hypothetical protein